MIIFDLINDEAPLSARALRLLFTQKKLDSSKVLGISEGNRWHNDLKEINCINRLHYFDELDGKGIDIEKELRRISKEYSNFNVFACDRNLVGKKRDFQRKMLVYTYLFFEEIFNDTITHYFTTGTAYTYNLVAYEVCNRYKIKHISYYITRIESRSATSFGISHSFDEVKSLYNEFERDKVKDFMYEPIRSFINRPVQPAFMKNAINAFTLRRVFVQEFFKRSIEYISKGKHKYDLFTKSPIQLGIIRLKKIITAKKINLVQNKVFDEINLKNRYFVFPLHMQPEASTLILAPFYVDQKAAIINISKLIPPDTYLYVKEHRSALGQHGMSFYKELKKYGNIRLVSYKINTFELIKNSIGTINLSGTVGLESLFFKKPSIVLGNVFYNDTGLTFKVNSFSQLEDTIKKVSEDGFEVEAYFEDYGARLAYYLYCLKEKSYPFEFNVAKMDLRERILKDQNIREYANSIYALIGN